MPSTKGLWCPVGRGWRGVSALTPAPRQSRAGFARSFGQQLPNGQRREWIKPIMFSGGIGAMEDIHVHKEPPEPGKYPPTLCHSLANPLCPLPPHSAVPPQPKNLPALPPPDLG